MKWKCSKSDQNVIFHPITTNLGQYDQLKGPLHNQQSMWKGSYSPKILHKKVLPEYVFMPILFLSENVWKVPKMSYFMQFWPILGPYDPLKSPLHYQQSMLNGSYSPKSLHKLVLPENGFISIFFEVKMFEKCPKCHISCNFGQFWDHMTHSKAPYTTNEVRYMAHILPKYSIK